MVWVLGWDRRGGGVWAEVYGRSSCDAIDRLITILLYKLPSGPGIWRGGSTC